MPGTVDTEGSKNFPQPKVAPGFIAQEALKAVVNQQENVYLGDQAKDMAVQLLTDPKALEKAIATLIDNAAQL